jgi:hypothetical protein
MNLLNILILSGCLNLFGIASPQEPIVWEAHSSIQAMTATGPTTPVNIPVDKKQAKLFSYNITAKDTDTWFKIGSNPLETKEVANTALNASTISEGYPMATRVLAGTQPDGTHTWTISGLGILEPKSVPVEGFPAAIFLNKYKISDGQLGVLHDLDQLVTVTLHGIDTTPPPPPGE